MGYKGNSMHYIVYVKTTCYKLGGKLRLHNEIIDMEVPFTTHTNTTKAKTGRTIKILKDKAIPQKLLAKTYNINIKT